MLWPNDWDGTFASHPRESETYVSSGERRMPEELGIEGVLDYLHKFEYHVPYIDVGSENEICGTLIGIIDKSIELKEIEGEIDEIKRISSKELIVELKENPQLTVEEFTTNIISCPEMKEANEIIGVGLKNEIKENIVVGCNYHTIWQSDPRMRFVLVEVKDNKAKLKTRHTRKEFWTELKDLIFIKSNYNKNKAISLTKPHTNKQC